MIRTRFAPSPTGFLTIGNLRSALYEYLIAKHEQGVFILRIEDTDQNRFVEGASDAVFETLRITNLNFDEGPGVGGDYGPYVQSERKDSYLPPALRLIEEGHAYHCFCSKERLDSLEFGYDRHCLHMPKEEVERRLAAGEPYVIRQIIPEGSTGYHDEVYGDITIENSEMDDQVLIKSDGMPTYNFANVIDDHAMRITHVVRGNEYLTSTPKYKLLYEALGWEVPIFVHLPLALNESGRKIGKRYGDPSVPQLIEMGFLPEALVNYTALLGWSPPDNIEIFTLAELTEAFDYRHISKSPSIFDMTKFTWVNGEHIKRLPFEKYCELALPVLKEAVKTPGIDYKKLAAMTQTRVNFIHEAAGLLDFIDTLPDYEAELYTHKKMKTDGVIAKKALELSLDALASFNDWTNDALYAEATRLAEANGMKNSQILWPIRTALSGKPTSPCGATELCELLGKDETLARIKTGIDKL
jgi:glutamyl-tRNA synthetase